MFIPFPQDGEDRPGGKNQIEAWAFAIMRFIFFIGTVWR
jgi:hypothetical protein